MTSYASTVYRLADTEVLIAVSSTPAGPQPLFTDVSGEPAVVAWTDVEQARAAAPDDAQVFSIAVAELAAQLPPHAGIVVDPLAASPVHVAAASKEQVVAAARPFPGGAPARIGDPEVEPEALLARLRDAAPQLLGLRRLWRTWYQVADARPRLLVVYEVAAPGHQGAPVADAVVRAAQDVRLEAPLFVLALEDLPDDARQWLLEHTPPFVERAA